MFSGVCTSSPASPRAAMSWRTFIRRARNSSRENGRSFCMAPLGARPPAALPGVLLVGVLGGSVGFVCYTNAVALTSVSLATLLLYTSPAWVTLLGWRFLHEVVTPRRLVAVGVAFLGCVLAARVYDPHSLR